MKKLITSVVAVMIMSFSTMIHAEWSYTYSKFDKSYYVSDGTNSIKFKTEKAAKKTAKALNKNDKKLSKKGNGFWNDQYCMNPENRC